MKIFKVIWVVKDLTEVSVYLCSLPSKLQWHWGFFHLVGMAKASGQQAGKKEGINKYAVKTCHHFFPSKSKAGIKKLNNLLVPYLRTIWLQAGGDAPDF